MFDWLTNRGRTTTTALPRVAPRIVRAAHPTAGEYESLSKYLRDRAASRVVLTFAEIEDLLGFLLPDPARLQLAWWNAGDLAGGPSPQSVAWTLAGRTAAVNLGARNVVFERDSAS